MNKIKSFLKFVSNSLIFDATQFRSRITLFFFNMTPDLLILSPLRNYILKLGGMKIAPWNAYIRSPFFTNNLKNVSIGRGVFINKHAYIDGGNLVSIGNFCQIGPYLKIENINHDTTSNMAPTSLPVTIGDNVWVASNVLILPGASISNDCTLAAGAVVAKSIYEPGRYGGVPAKKLAIKNK